MKHTQPEPGRRYPLLEKYRKEMSRCVKCGSCSAVCPSYLHERDESFSARGRMTLIKAVLDGRLSFSGIFKDRLATCTTCLACEASCPSNVPVTEIIQAAQEQAVAESGLGVINNFIATLVKQPALFRAAAWLAPVVLHYSGQGPGRESRARRSHGDGGDVQSSKFKVQRKPGGGAGSRSFAGARSEHFSRTSERRRQAS